MASETSEGRLQLRKGVDLEKQGNHWEKEIFGKLQNGGGDWKLKKKYLLETKSRKAWKKSAFVAGYYYSSMIGLGFLC